MWRTSWSHFLEKRGVGNIRVCKKAVIHDITLGGIRTFLFRTHKSYLSHKTCSVHLSFVSMIFDFSRNDESQLNVINKDVSRANNSPENTTLGFVTFEIGFLPIVCWNLTLMNVRKFYHGVKLIPADLLSQLIIVF